MLVWLLNTELCQLISVAPSCNGRLYVNSEYQGAMLSETKESDIKGKGDTSGSTFCFVWRLEVTWPVGK